MSKRKKNDEYRTFKHEWTEEFAFVERTGSALCLFRNAQISFMIRLNVKRHFDTSHATFASKYPEGENWKKACFELSREVKATAPINSRLNVVVRSPAPFGLGRNGCWPSRGSQLPRALPIHFFAMLPPERPQKGST